MWPGSLSEFDSERIGLGSFSGVDKFKDLSEANKKAAISWLDQRFSNTGNPTGITIDNNHPLWRVWEALDTKGYKHGGKIC